MKIPVPSVAQIIDLHDCIVQRTGGAHGIRSMFAIESAWARTEAHQYYQAGITPIQVAATLCVSVAKAHGFVDGNKRAAYAALNLTLQFNGMQITAQNDDTVRKLISSAAGKGGPQELEAWLKENSQEDPVYQALFDYDAAGPESSY